MMPTAFPHVGHFGATVAGIAASMQQRRSNHHESTDRTNDSIDRTTRSIDRSIRTIEPNRSNERFDRSIDSIDRAIRTNEPNRSIEPIRADRTNDSIDRTKSNQIEPNRTRSNRIARSMIRSIEPIRTDRIIGTIRWIGPHRSDVKGCLDAR